MDNFDNKKIAQYNSIAMGEVAGRAKIFGPDDRFGMLSLLDRCFADFEPIRIGTIITYHPNTHSALVMVQGAATSWPCIFSDEVLAYSFGYSLSAPPCEGEHVLVCQAAKSVEFGIIIGRMPYPLNFGASGDLFADPDGYHRRSYTADEQKKRTWDINIPSVIKPFQRPEDNSTHISTNFRPTDVYPGEFSYLNQHNCGIKGGLFSATLLGGGANLRLSALSNTARLSCESYQRMTLTGRYHEIHNGRYVSSERDIAMYQEERLGGIGRSAEVFTEDAEANKGGEAQTIRPRIKELSGYFGHLVSKFCLRPDPKENSVRVQGESHPIEAGVSRETIDPSGQYRLSAAGMIAIERTGRIPVPVRKANPYDNGHDISDGYFFGGISPEELEPFEHDADDPACRQLELYDRQAYDLKNQYARIDGLGDSDKSHADYDVPQEEDLPPLEDQYDPNFTKSATVSLNKFDKRRAGVYIGEDGSVIIRDAWGSEVVMLGGNISMSCAGNIQILPGRTALTIAGDDIVQKAQNSIDIHASAHDVRLSAARNMEMVGGGSKSGGVIIESKGTGISPWDGESVQGEAVLLSGVAIRAPGQAVTVDGELLNLRSRGATRIISGDSAVDGDIGIAAKTLRTVAQSTVMAGSECDDKEPEKILSTIANGLVKAGSRNGVDNVSDNGRGGFQTDGDASLLYITDKNIISASPSIGMFAGKSLAATRGSKFPVPFAWVDVENIYDKIKGQLEKLMNQYRSEKSISLEFTHDKLDKMQFGFRTSEECGTTKSWTIGDKSDDNDRFKMYEPAWRQVLKIYDTLSGIEDKPYDEFFEGEPGRPWPGEEAESRARYVRLDDWSPANLDVGGWNKRRDKVDAESDITDGPLKSEYRIRK